MLGDHALVFSLEEKMSEEIIEKIMALKKSIETLHFDFIKELIPSYHTLTLVYDIDLFYQNNITFKNNQSVIEFGNDMLTAFNSAATNSTIKNAAEKIKANNNLIENNSFTDREKIIQIPVCYDERLGIDLENIVSRNKISIEEIIKIHTEETYLVYCLGFLPGFAYMGKVNAAIQIARHASPRKEVQAGSVGIAGLQTGIYPTNCPGGWQIIGKTPLKIFDPHPDKLAKFKVGDRVQFYSISKSVFDSLNEYL